MADAGMPVNASAPVDPEPVEPLDPVEPGSPEAPLVPPVPAEDGLAVVVVVAPPAAVVVAVDPAAVVVVVDEAGGVVLADASLSDQTNLFGSVVLAVKVTSVFQLSVSVPEVLAQAIPTSHTPEVPPV
jgi:hypothetical protein